METKRLRDEGSGGAGDSDRTEVTPGPRRERPQTEGELGKLAESWLETVRKHLQAGGSDSAER